MFDADRETGAQVWQTPAGLLPLGADEVQVWRISLAEALAGFEFYRSLLSADELERAGRYIVAHPRNEFLVARGCLRMLLGHVLGIAPRAVAFRLGEHGKPALARDAGVEFNVAHAKDVILIALRRGVPVGVDVEWIDPGMETLELAEVTFTAREFEVVRRAAPGRERLLTFYRCWTQKEAVTKADGRGLTLSPMTFEVPIFDGVEAVLQSGAGVASSAKVCEQIYGVFPLRMGEDYLGTLATCTPCGDVLSCWFPLPRTEQHPVTGAPHQRLRAFLSVQRLASTGSHRQRARSNLHKLQGPFWVVQEGNSFWLPICIRREHKVGWSEIRIPSRLQGR